MRYDGDHKAETRARVLKEAAREIRTKGPAGLGVAGVMSRAGLTHGGFYAHFASKDEMVAETITAMFDDVWTRFEHVYRARDAGIALSEYIDFYLSTKHRDARDRGCPIAALSSDVPRLGATPRERFGAGVASLIDWLADALERFGIESARPVATAMVAQLVGALSLARSVGDNTQSEAILGAARTDLKQRLGLETAV